MRPGFTIIETMVTVIMLSIVGAMALPSISRSMTTTRIDRAAQTVASDVEAAFSLAARQRRPVLLVVDSVNRRVEIRDRTSATVLQTRSYGLQGSEYGLTRLASSVSGITVFPNGLASGPFVIYAVANQSSRAVRVLRTGQIRITEP
jgi:prepilin-type N-terminal cleavage/methylation domain-containing protein